MIDGTLGEQVVLNIIRKEMEIPQNNIWVRDQNRKIPDDDGLYLIAGMVDSMPMSAVTYMKQVEIPQPDPTPPIINQVEVNEVQLCENIQIDILSRSNDALKRRWEIIAALRSIYSQQQQEKYFCKIARLPRSFVNASAAEGGSQLNRFSLSFAIFVWYRKEKTLNGAAYDYYDDFTTRVDDEKTIGTPEGIFDFRIAAED